MEKKTTIEEYINDYKAYRLIYEGNIEDGAVFLGQSIGIINNIEKVPDIINKIVNDAEKKLKTAVSLIK